MLLQSEHNSNDNTYNNNNNKTSWEFLGYKTGFADCACPCTIMMEILSLFKFSRTNKIKLL